MWQNLFANAQASCDHAKQTCAAVAWAAAASLLRGVQLPPFSRISAVPGQAREAPDKRAYKLTCTRLLCSRGSLAPSALVQAFGRHLACAALAVADERAQARPAEGAERWAFRFQVSARCAPASMQAVVQALLRSCGCHRQGQLVSCAPPWSCRGCCGRQSTLRRGHEVVRR